MAGRVVLVHQIGVRRSTTKGARRPEPDVVLGESNETLGMCSTYTYCIVLQMTVFTLGIPLIFSEECRSTEVAKYDQPNIVNHCASCSTRLL